MKGGGVAGRCGAEGSKARALVLLLNSGETSGESVSPLCLGFLVCETRGAVYRVSGSMKGDFAYRVLVCCGAEC